MTRSMLLSMGLLDASSQVAAPAASREEIEAFHLPRYLDVLIAAEKGHLDVEGLHMGLGTPETPVFAGMYDYSALACGLTLEGARRIADGTARVAFNPSGGYHHARPSQASGFCYLNDVALACLLLAAGRKVLFLDIDVHHGDGMQQAFYERRDVLTMSFHETGRTLFPWGGFENEIGDGEGRGYNVNVPLPPGTHDEAYLGAFRGVALPILEAFDPDVIVLEIGMDALAGDPLAHLSLTNNAYADIIELVMRAGKPVLATGGGGYHARNTARGWALAWSLLSGQQAGTTADHALGGVMLESTDWQGGLRDRALIPDARRKPEVDAAIAQTVEKVRSAVFPIHGL